MKRAYHIKHYKIKQTIAAVAAMVIMLFSMYINIAAMPVYAQSTMLSAFEKINVLDDLQGSIIEGKPFEVSEYTASASSMQAQLITLVEFGYSYDASPRDYGLYAYVYNPQKIEFNLTAETNEIHIRAGKNESAGFTVYRLTFLNRSTAAGYKGMFLKFRVEMTDVRKSNLMKTLDRNERVYEVGEIQLMTKDKGFEVSGGAKYTYTGFAKGYGADGTAESTLKSTSEGGLLTLSLEVESTAFRPDGSNGKNEFTQDSLHSVYFSIPNEIIDSYGDISQIYAKWLNATLKPGLVTGNREMYEKLLPIVAHQIPFSSIADFAGYGLDFPYMYLGAYSERKIGLNNAMQHLYGYGIHGNYQDSLEVIIEDPTIYGNKLDELPIVLYADNGNADKSVFESTKALHDYVKEYPNICPADLDPLQSFELPKSNTLVGDKYPEFLFSRYDKEYTEKRVSATERVKLEDYEVGKEWWNHLFGGVSFEDKKFPAVKAIQQVKDRDLNGSEDEISKKLCVGKADINDFLDFCESAEEKDETVYLFRYYQSDFVAQEATLLETKKNWLGICKPNKIDTNAYFFQTDVNLNFDIIDISYTKGETTTTIPVVSKPIDVIPNPTPPIITTPDFVWWPYGVGIMGALVVAFIVIVVIYRRVKDE